MSTQSMTMRIEHSSIKLNVEFPRMRLVEYSMAIIQRERESKGGKKIDVDDRVEKPRWARIGRGWTKGARLRAQGGPCTAEYAYRTRPPIVIPHRRCQALLTRQFCHGNATTLYFNARKEIIRVNMGKSMVATCVGHRVRKLVRSMKNFWSRLVVC